MTRPDPVPLATCRLQLNHEFTFDHAAGLAGYLKDLGVSHVYASPVLQAAAGSMHGYDVVDPSHANDEMGGDAGWEALVRVLSEAGLGVVLDIVPNHMAIAAQRNRWWWDILENGVASPFARWFDIDWGDDRSAPNRVLVPILGDHVGKVVRNGQIKLSRSGGEFVLDYFGQQTPAALTSLDGLLRQAAGQCGSEELAFIAAALARLHQPPEAGASTFRPDRCALGKMLARLLSEPAVAAAVDESIQRVNRDAAAMLDLLDRQHYRLAFWKTAGQIMNYRRFFAIDTLVGLRVEEEEVFEATHCRVLEWADKGWIDGLRIDHPDGLRRPAEYLRRLRSRAPGAWIVVEKILEPGEDLPPDWPVAGTTGYDFIYRADQVLVDGRAQGPLTDFYTQFTGHGADFGQLVHDKKLKLLTESFGGELERLTSVLAKVCRRWPEHRDYGRLEMLQALGELAACFPVYRSYVDAPTGHVSEMDRRYVGRAVADAHRRRPDISGGLLDFIGDVLVLDVRRACETAGDDPEADLAMRFAQLTGAAMAKGVEDTAFYCFHRLISLNEVGGDPARFGIDPQEFHRLCRASAQHWPTAMLASSTHDTKRSEDVRARIHVLSEIPRQWSQVVIRWARINERFRTDAPDGGAGAAQFQPDGDGRWPDRHAEYLFYQTLLGAWPIQAPRMQACMHKALREAKLLTSWTDPNEPYEKAVTAFIDSVMGDGQFMQDLEAFVRPLVHPGRVNSLAMTLLKLTCPGVPDFYQGTELWDNSLVDPDNRRPVDYGLRHRLLGEVSSMTAAQAMQRIDEGLPKLYLIHKVLRQRRLIAGAFRDGGYTPLGAAGPKADNVLAFVRGDAAVTIVPRLSLSTGGDWQGTHIELPPGNWEDCLTGRAHGGQVADVGDLLADFPVALLVRRPAEKGAG